MSHRVIIISALKSLFEQPEVREELPTAKLAKVDSICTHAEPNDEDFRFLTRRLNQVYCSED